jgi:hypothetical protein
MALTVQAIFMCCFDCPEVQNGPWRAKYLGKGLIVLYLGHFRGAAQLGEAPGESNGQ